MNTSTYKKLLEEEERISKKIEEDEGQIFSLGSNLTRENALEKLEDIYKYVKSVSNEYYNGEIMHPFYKNLRNDILLIEEKVRLCGKILDVPVSFNINQEPKNILEKIIFLSRKHLIEKHFSCYLKNNTEIPYNQLNLSNYCKESAFFIKEICDNFNIKCFIVPIYPGYTKEFNLYNGCGFHFFNIIYLDDKYYLLDSTYSQFFYKDRNSLERIGIVNLSGCSVGRFMLLNENSKKVAIELLKNGYLELDEKLLKIYLDAFTISFRNGLFYENTNDFSFTANYSFNDYLNFLKGNDNQVNYEGIENLGYQKRPLKSNYLR